MSTSAFDSAPRGVQRQQGRAITARIAPRRHSRRDSVSTSEWWMRNTRPWQAPAWRRSVEHQTGHSGRAPADRGGQRKAACKTVEPGPAHFAEVDAGVPHQRAVAKPEVFAVAPGQHGLARALDLLVGERQSGAALCSRAPASQAASTSSVRRSPEASPSVMSTRQFGKVREALGVIGRFAGGGCVAGDQLRLPTAIWLQARSLHNLLACTVARSTVEGVAFDSTTT